MSNNKNIMSRLLIIGVIISLSLSMPLFAQKIDATLRGKILDTDGQVLPGVKILATNIKTGEEFIAYSSEYGRYLLPALPASVYEIKAELEGFATQVLKDVELKIGQEAIIDITLKLATVSETIVVTGETPLVEVTKSHMGEVISRETIDSMPLKGRDFTDLMLLLPGASDVGAQSGGKVSFLGERTYTVSYLIDGASNDNDIDGGYVQDFNQDAIQEFEVIPEGYKAEYGKASGGVSNIITKSGTNEFHGRAFLFLRDDAMTWISHEGQVLPELRRYEYGATFGGPIKKNKAWFFGSVELVPEDRGVTFVPEQYTLAAMERWVEGWDLGIIPQDRNYTYFGKINANISEKHRLVANFNINDFNVINQGANFPGFTYDTVNTSYSFTARDTWMLSDTTLTEMTFKYLKHNYSAAKELLESAESGINHGYVRLRIWAYPGSPHTSTNSSTSVTTPRTQNDDRIEAIWNLSKFIEDWNGSHDMKFGFDFSRVTISGERGQFKEAGQGAFGALYWPYDGDNPLSWMNIGYSAAHLRDEAISYYDTPDAFIVNVKNNQYGLFAQDSWQLKEGFTVNLGVRYDFESLFYEDKNNISPRLGFAWDPWKDGKTVIRGSAGVFYDQNLMNAVLNDPDLGGAAIGVSFSFVYPRLGAGFFGDLSDWASSYGKDPYSMWGSLTGAYDYFGIPYNPNDPASWPIVSKDNVQELTGLSPDQFLAVMGNLFPSTYWSWSYLDGWLQSPTTPSSGPTQVYMPIRPFKTTYTLSYAIGIERKLTDTTAVEVRYNYRNINNMLGTWITNLMPDGSGRTINNEPSKVQRAYYGWHRIHNVTATLEKRLSENFTFLASYAFNHNWTNMPMGIGYRPSKISGTYFFPLDISVSGIFRWRSGTVYGPATARWDPDGDGSGGTPPADRWPYDEVSNANCFTLPSWKNVDLRVQKNFKFGRYNAAVLAEFFNLFNFDNVTSYKGGVIVLPNSYYQLADDYHQAWAWSRGREMQIGFRFDF
jgi:hypothetical protein